MHRTLREESHELYDIFSWQSVRKLSNSLTFQYNQVVYLIENSEENARLVHENVLILEHMDGHISVRYGHRSLKFKIFDKLEKVSQGQIVDNKRLGQVLQFAKEKQDEFESKNKRKRQSRVVSVIGQRQAMNEQLRALNPVLLEPDQFTASHSR